MGIGPSNKGYVPPAVTPRVSAAAGAMRSAAILGRVSRYDIPAKPRSVVDQGQLPCCVSCALGAALEMLNPSAPALAPLFHYHVARYVDAAADPDGFLYLGNALGTLATRGICNLKLYSHAYTPEGARSAPTSAAYGDALTRAPSRQGVHRRYAPSTGASRVAWIRDQLSRDRPVVVGLRLPQNYPATFLNGRFEWLDPAAVPISDSGHCVLAIGYSDLRQALHIQDSRGAAAFDGGHWWMGYRVADSPVVTEAYCLIP